MKTMLVKPLLTDVTLEPLNFTLVSRIDLSKKRRFDRGQTITVTFRDHKLRDHHLLYKTV